METRRYFIMAARSRSSPLSNNNRNVRARLDTNNSSSSSSSSSSISISKLFLGDKSPSSWDDLRSATKSFDRLKGLLREIGFQEDRDGFLMNPTAFGPRRFEMSVDIEIFLLQNGIPGWEKLSKPQQEDLEKILRFANFYPYDFTKAEHYKIPFQIPTDQEILPMLREAGFALVNNQHHLESLENVAIYIRSNEVFTRRRLKLESHLYIRTWAAAHKAPLPEYAPLQQQSVAMDNSITDNNNQETHLPPPTQPRRWNLENNHNRLDDGNYQLANQVSPGNEMEPSLEADTEEEGEEDGEVTEDDEEELQQPPEAIKEEAEEEEEQHQPPEVIKQEDEEESEEEDESQAEPDAVESNPQQPPVPAQAMTPMSRYRILRDEIMMEYEYRTETRAENNLPSERDALQEDPIPEVPPPNANIEDEIEGLKVRLANVCRKSKLLDKRLEENAKRGTL